VTRAAAPCCQQADPVLPLRRQERLYQALAERHTRKLIEGIRDEFSRGDPIRDRTRSTIDTYLATISKNLNLYRFLMLDLAL
jgi:hypothetical protein